MEHGLMTGVLADGAGHRFLAVPAQMTWFQALYANFLVACCAEPAVHVCQSHFIADLLGMRALTDNASWLLLWRQICNGHDVQFERLLLMLQMLLLLLVLLLHLLLSLLKTLLLQLSS